MYLVCVLLFCRKVNKGEAECTKASFGKITKCRFLMFNCYILNANKFPR